MAALLHHPDFQALESAWRGLDWLLRRVEKKSGVAVVLHDITRDELAADLTGTEDLSATALHRLLIEQGAQGPKGQPWGLLLGHYPFDATAEDAEVLGRLAKLARRASAPFVAAGAGRLLEKDFEPDGEAAAAWDALRELPEAAWVGLGCRASCCGCRTARTPSRSTASLSRSSPALPRAPATCGATRPSPAAACWGWRS
jgi:type VI secretion system protein ImpC